MDSQVSLYSARRQGHTNALHMGNFLVHRPLARSVVELDSLGTSQLRLLLTRDPHHGFLLATQDGLAHDETLLAPHRRPRGGAERFPVDACEPRYPPRVYKLYVVHTSSFSRGQRCQDVCCVVVGSSVPCTVDVGNSRRRKTIKLNEEILARTTIGK